MIKIHVEIDEKKFVILKGKVNRTFPTPKWKELLKINRKLKRK